MIAAKRSGSARGLRATKHGPHCRPRRMRPRNQPEEMLRFPRFLPAGTRFSRRNSFDLIPHRPPRNSSHQYSTSSPLIDAIKRDWSTGDCGTFFSRSIDRLPKSRSSLLQIKNPLLGLDRLLTYRPGGCAFRSQSWPDVAVSSFVRASSFWFRHSARSDAMPSAIRRAARPNTSPKNAIRRPRRRRRRTSRRSPPCSAPARPSSSPSATA